MKKKDFEEEPEQRPDEQESQPAGKAYRLIIPSWNVAVPKEWGMRLKGKDDSEFVVISGNPTQTLVMVKGDEFTFDNAPEGLIDGMLDQKFIEEG